MGLVMRVNQLKRTDHNTGSNDNLVTSLRAPQGRPALHLFQNKDGIWEFNNGDGPNYVDVLPHQTNLASALDQVLAEADSSVSGLLQIGLVGERLFVIPRHHWPVLEITHEG